MRLLTKDEHIENGIISASCKHYEGSTAQHRHEFFEIEYIISGSGTCTVNGKEYPVEENMIFFMTPADVHRFSSEKSELINIMFSCEYVNTEELFRLTSSSLPCMKLTDTHDIRLVEGLLYEIVACFDRKNIESVLTFLSALTVKLTSFAPENDRKLPSDICRVMLYLLERFKEGVRLEDAAQYVGFSSAYLSSLFKKHTGMTFKSYLNSLQFDYAAKMLSFSDKNVQQICYESGFSDYSNFERRFRKRFGCSPKEYRALHIQGELF
ncbi:MAG: AraC family transcriptional regulator [Ruminococcaceae bacterium]|nr:AraC family transcriptional regulator [Oscillospiraceae bacterium]